MPFRQAMAVPTDACHARLGPSRHTDAGIFAIGFERAETEGVLLVTFMND